MSNIAIRLRFCCSGMGATNFISRANFRSMTISIDVQFNFQDETTAKFGIISGSEEKGYKVIDKFVELGGNFFDTANIYSSGSSERVLGNWLKKYVIILHVCIKQEI